MVRAPYPARVAAGLIVTAIEETRKLPALLITLPMTAVSQTLQAGMRAQQNIAELAIKGDAALELLFDKPQEEPAWAHFDDDEAPANVVSINNADPVAAGIAATAATPIEKPAAKAPVKKTPAKKAPAGKDPAKRAAETTAETTGPETAGPQPATTQPAKAPVSDDATPAAGRFALYSSAPESVVTAPPTTETTPAKPAGKVPEVVEYIEYDGLTLAQLRAKLRSVSPEDLETLSAYEKDNRNRAPFVTMLDNRIAAQNKRPTDT